jgi:hypothetical protein
MVGKRNQIFNHWLLTTSHLDGKTSVDNTRDALGPFFCLGDNKLSAVSDGALELLQQIVSDLNRSKCQLFLCIWAADEKR